MKTTNKEDQLKKQLQLSSEDFQHYWNGEHRLFTKITASIERKKARNFGLRILVGSLSMALLVFLISDFSFKGIPQTSGEPSLTLEHLYTWSTPWEDHFDDLWDDSSGDLVALSTDHGGQFNTSIDDHSDKDDFGLEEYATFYEEIIF